MEPEKDFGINEEDLEGEACKQCQLMVHYGDLHANTRSIYMAEEERLKRVYAETAQLLREKAKADNEKVTENIINERVLSSSAYIVQQDAVQEARVRSMKADAWWRTLQQKAEMIKVVGYRQGMEMKNY